MAEIAAEEQCLTIRRSAGDVFRGDVGASARAIIDDERGAEATAEWLRHRATDEIR
jgi:hypothetical protein